MRVTIIQKILLGDSTDSTKTIDTLKLRAELAKKEFEKIFKKHGIEGSFLLFDFFGCHGLGPVIGHCCGTYSHIHIGINGMAGAIHFLGRSDPDQFNVWVFYTKMRRSGYQKYLFKLKPIWDLFQKVYQALTSIPPTSVEAERYVNGDKYYNFKIIIFFAFPLKVLQCRGTFCNETSLPSQ